MTLAVLSSGTEEKRCRFLFDAVVFLAACTVSGGFTGFIYAAIVYSVANWLPFHVKAVVLGFITLLFLLNQFGWLRLHVPQRHWQIPVSWVNKGTMRDMVVWGVILGAGIFTYIPFVTFYLTYVYIGFFMVPSIGFWAGMMYGVSRALPTMVLAMQRNTRYAKEDDMLCRFHKWHKLCRIVNTAVLMLLLFYLLWLLYTRNLPAIFE